MTVPTPAPADVDVAQIAGEALVVGLVVAVAAAVVVGFVTFLLLRAADKPPGSMVVLALSLLTLVSLAVYAGTRADVMAGVVGTGIGALAGAVTTQLGSDNRPNGRHVRRDTPPDTPKRPGREGD